MATTKLFGDVFFVLIALFIIQALILPVLARPHLMDNPAQAAIGIRASFLYLARIQNRESLRHLKNGMGEEVVIAATVVDTTMVGTTTGPAMETDHVMEMVRATEMEQAMEMTQVLVMETDLAMGMDLEDIIEEEEEEVAAEEAGEEGVAEVEVEVEAVAVAVAAGEGEEEEVTIEPVNSITNECSGVDKIDQ
ncbi:uncharacterized protein [Physcomitrium patens]|uniref:uncharacterized protein isoform X2 n=1 Tax=Physcomitrium patens TaxID=3218 RepID=UPI000D1670AF|nr:uncharacterized protein LOC112281219 isoform X2 [Physcomitrium patens]|eukprot:XP_024373268.1 uncharacterized protein LOC112281219 isoform X2 [Physcomitrella patens]